MRLADKVHILNRKISTGDDANKFDETIRASLQAPEPEVSPNFLAGESVVSSAKISPSSTEEVRVMTSAHSAFTTRQNLDGSFDLICLHCFLTAGNTKNKSELLAIERTHQCDPILRLMLDRSSDEETDEARGDEPHESQESQHPQ
jgi:hypothetical protein